MQIPAKYSASLVESKWYKYWMEHNYFHSKLGHREYLQLAIAYKKVPKIAK